jgi:hypothetical protein
MDEETDDQGRVITLPSGTTTRSENQIRVQADTFQQVYANNIQIGFSAFDMALAFGQIKGQQDDKPVIEESVRIMLTRELAKVLVGLLINNINAYEQQFGEIKIPVPLLQGDVEDLELSEPASQPAATKRKRAKK